MSHDPLCGQYCPYPDLDYVTPGASLPKCRGGDCTLCDEIDCACDLIALVRKDEADRVMSLRYNEVKGWSEFRQARAYAAGIQAARDAVAALPHDLTCFRKTVIGCTCTRGGALAAIDALRGER